MGLYLEEEIQNEIGKTFSNPNLGYHRDDIVAFIKVTSLNHEYQKNK